MQDPADEPKIALVSDRWFEVATRAITQASELISVQSDRIQELEQYVQETNSFMEGVHSTRQLWNVNRSAKECTFIILAADVYRNSKQQSQKELEIEAMVGDVNLFFNEEDVKTTAEIEIMIAESTARGQGLGKAALLSMMRYGVEVLKLTQITAKIGYSNTPSLSMFNKLGFVEVSHSDVFEEVTLELNIDDRVQQLFHSGTPGYRLDNRPSSS